MTTQTLAPSLPALSPPRRAQDRAISIVCILLGCALSLAIQGYQFGKSNHTVYLLDALRHLTPGALQHDWFVTQTLQYHAAFGLLTRALASAGLLKPGFLVGYLALLLLLHGGWWKIVRALGSSATTFLLSEALFHLLACGTGLGMYQFLQDGAFLPSNIASVAMLWGLYFWMVQRRGRCAIAFGVAGFFHLDYAIVAPAVWMALWLESRWWDSRRLTLNEFFAFLAMCELCLMNIAPALIFTWHHKGTMPLTQFINLYVHLRHPHHYDPLAWPGWLWASFLLPIPFAFLGWRKSMLDQWDPGILAAVRSAVRICEIILALLLIALLTAGIWYVSEAAVQLSLWRFSVFVKLLTCIGLAMWIEQRIGVMRMMRGVARTPSPGTPGENWGGGFLSAIASTVILSMVAACLIRGPYFGLFHMPEDPPSYLAACDWIRTHTPADAIFLVPPDEQEFRLRARRAIVVNYKCVPQLSAELAVWRDRLEDVLMLPNLQKLPTPFPKTLKAIHQRYESLPPDHYAEVAKKYGARYILLAHRLPESWDQRRIDLNGNTAWFLYDLSQ
jgi:hypothetical protein